MIELCGLPTRFCDPSVWKPAMGCTADKKKTKRVAHLLFPHCRSILTSEAKAEAALIGLYTCLQLQIVPKHIVPA